MTGDELFRRWLAAAPGNTQRVVAQICGVAPSLVSGWARGESVPAEYLRPALFKLTGIRPPAWRTAEQRQRAREALGRVRGRLDAGAEPKPAEPKPAEPDPAIDAASRTLSLFDR